MDMFGYIYNNVFNPLNLTQNLIEYDDDNGGNAQFLFSINLQSTVRYILVATTYGPNVTGAFGISALGPGNVTYI